MDDLVDKITKLLRLAKDQQGTPEGDTVLAIAKRMMADANIVVELDDRYERVISSDETVVVVIATYPRIESWRQHLVTLIQVIYGVDASWTTGQYDVDLVFSANARRAKVLEVAIDYYFELEDAIAVMEMRAPSSIQMGFYFRRVNPRHPRTIELFRRGVVDAWADVISKYAGRRRDEAEAAAATTAEAVAENGHSDAKSEASSALTIEDVEDPEPGVPTGPTALVRVQAFRRPTVEVPESARPEAPMQPHEASEADMLDAMIYKYGVDLGFRTYDWPVPDLGGDRDGEDLDEDGVEEAH